jgi:hypothetical protein
MARATPALDCPFLPAYGSRTAVAPLGETRNKSFPSPRRPPSAARYDPRGKRGYTLAQAREKVAELEALRREHGNVVAYLERKEAERRRAEQERKGTLGELLAAYVEKLKRERKQSAREVEMPSGARRSRIWSGSKQPRSRLRTSTRYSRASKPPGARGW